jgi:hypothetical protein
MFVVVDYDEDTVAAMLAALHTCPSDLRLDSLAVVVKLFAEDHPFVTSLPARDGSAS